MSEAAQFPCHGIDVRKLAVIFRELGGVIEHMRVPEILTAPFPENLAGLRQ